jgi:hypothetical protein
LRWRIPLKGSAYPLGNQLCKTSKPLLKKSNPIKRATLDTTSQQRGRREKVRKGKRASLK